MPQSTADTRMMPVLYPTDVTYESGMQEYTGSKQRVYRVVLKRDEDGRFVATCPDLQGVVTDGADEEEAMMNVIDAIETMLEARGLPIEEFNLIPIITL